jgi:RecA-family ATPase
MPFEIPQQILDMNPRCVPIRVGLKSPAIKDWPNTQVRAQDLDTTSDKYDKYGIVLDEDMLVVDIDVHDDAKNGYASLSRIKDEHGIDLWSAASIVVESPSGGAHLYFNNPDLEKLPKSTQEFPGLDFLTKGCQVIGPGSSHATFAGTYKITRGNDLICDLPFGLAEVLNFQFEDVVPSSVTPEDSPLDAFNMSSEALEVIKGELEGAGYTVITKGDGTYEFVRPGVRESAYKISGTIGIKSKNDRLLLRNFSTSDPSGFPSDAAVTLAEAFRILKGLTMDQLPSELRTLGYGSSSDISDDEVKRIQDEMRSARTRGDDLEESYPTQTLDELRKASPERRPYVIEGLLRRGETMNLIAAPKTGKSWFVYNLAARLATGGEFLGWTAPHNLKCMIVDNELHPEELAFRVGSVQDAMEVNFGDDLHFTCLRGAAVDMNHIEQKLVASGASRFDVIILDALYRFIPAGTSENDNAQMMLIYNTIDRIARTFDCSVICVHHASKGNQTEKQVSDVGAGAGAISRAADTQVVLFPHEQEGMVCVEAITRSSKTPKSRSATLDGFLWTLCDDEAVRKNDQEPKQDKKAQSTIQNQMKRSARAKKVQEFLEKNPIIRPEDAQEVLGESKTVLRTLLRDHLMPAGVVEFKQFFYQKTEAWSDNLAQFIKDPSTPTERGETD